MIEWEALCGQEWEQQQQPPHQAELAAEMQRMGSKFSSNFGQMGGIASPLFQYSAAQTAVNRYHSPPHTPLARGPRYYWPKDREEDGE